MPSSLISDIERQVRERIAELEPLVREYEKLLEVAATFAGESTAPPARRHRTRGASATTRARAAGGRSDQALELVAQNPGISVAELAEKMHIGPTYLYRVLPALEREGKVKKQGKGYIPA